MKAATHRVTWNGETPTFHCDGDRESGCHNFPDCECEYATDEHVRKHPNVPHDDQCWVIGWIKVEPIDTFYDGGDARLTEGQPPHIDAVIEWEWEGDYMLWTYADSDAAVEAQAKQEAETD